jgi:hypothetical protein
MKAMYGPAKALDPIAEMKVLERIRSKHWRTAKLVCSPKSGPLFELALASDMELNYG